MEWVDQVDQEAKAVAKAVKEARARGDRVQDPKAISDGSKSDDKDYVGEGEDEDEDEVSLRQRGRGWLYSLP